jgi:exodeoxyribonuclease VII large subunit
VAEPLELFPTPPRPVRTVSLVRLSGELARALAGVGQIAVQGEVHNPKTRPNGRIYFTLRDRTATLSVTCPAKAARRSRVVGGERVTVTGSLSWVPEWGRTELVAEEVVPVGAGAQAALVARAFEAMRADGLLDRPRRPLPRLPRLVAVVCGAEAAVRRDIESVVAVRFPGYPVRFVECTVSGPGAAGAIEAALERACALPEVDVVVLARGGGDATQLLAWSDEELCRAVAAAPVPVVSAIGHEEDRPLCDQLADARFGTPSIAAAAVIPHRVELTSELAAGRAGAGAALRVRFDAAGRRLAAVDTRRALDAALLRAGNRSQRAGDRLAAASPDRALERSRASLAGVRWRAPMARRAERADDRLAGLSAQLHALAPARVLERGYAVVRGPDGAVLRAAGAVAVGDAVTVELAAGRLRARVEGLDGGGDRPDALVDAGAGATGGAGA